MVEAVDHHGSEEEQRGDDQRPARARRRSARDDEEQDNDDDDDDDDDLAPQGRGVGPGVREVGDCEEGEPDGQRGRGDPLPIGGHAGQKAGADGRERQRTGRHEIRQPVRSVEVEDRARPVRAEHDREVDDGLEHAEQQNDGNGDDEHAPTWGRPVAPSHGHSVMSLRRRVSSPRGTSVGLAAPAVPTQDGARAVRGRGMKRRISPTTSGTRTARNAR